MRLPNKLKEYLVTDSRDRKDLRIARGKEQFPDGEFYFCLGSDYSDLDHFERQKRMSETVRILESRYQGYAEEIRAREIIWPQLAKNVVLEVLATCVDGVYVPFFMSGTRVSIDCIRKAKRPHYKRSSTN